jgi:uncharacterized protein YebE (UPF0316 family)
MDFTNWFDPVIYIWVILPLFIFTARVIDVTLGTMRIVYLSRGKRYLAPILGFFEVFIWIVAVSELIRNMTHIGGFLAYAAGFAAGNYLGLVIEDRLALGHLSVRIITVKEAEALVERLHQGGYGVTAIDAQGATGRVKVIYSIIKRKDFQNVFDIIKSCNPKAFISVEEVRSAREGIFPQARRHYKGQFRYWLRGLRK